MSYYVSQDILTAQLGPDILPAIHAGQITATRNADGTPLFNFDEARQAIKERQAADARIEALYAEFVDSCAVAYANGQDEGITFDDAQAQDIIEMAGRSQEQVAFDIRNRGEFYVMAQTGAARVHEVLAAYPLGPDTIAAATEIFGDDQYCWLVLAMAYRSEQLELDDDEFRAMLHVASKSEDEFDADWQGINKRLTGAAA